MRATGRNASCRPCVIMRGKRLRVALHPFGRVARARCSSMCRTTAGRAARRSAAPAASSVSTKEKSKRPSAGSICSQATGISTRVGVELVDGRPDLRAASPDNCCCCWSARRASGTARRRRSARACRSLTDAGAAAAGHGHDRRERQDNAPRAARNASTLLPLRLFASRVGSANARAERRARGEGKCLAP